MPIRSSLNGQAAAVAPSYPKMMQARVSGNVWLVTSPKTGVVVHVGARARDAKIGYTSNKLAEGKLAPFSGTLSLSA